MFKRSLLSLALGLSLVQMSPTALAADGDKALLAAANGLSGTGADTTLYRARWSLPSCGTLKPITTTTTQAKEDSDDDLPTPASVEAAAKKAAPKKAASKPAVVDSAAQAASSMHAIPANSVAPANMIKNTAQTAAVPVSKPQVVRSQSMQEGPIVRLNISPVAIDEEQTATQAPQAVQTANTNRAPVNPSNLVQPQEQTSSAPLPGSAPIPGAQPSVENAIRRAPGKTAAKGDTQASIEGTSESPKVIQLGVSVWNNANISKIVEQLVDMHVTQSPEAQALDKKVEHFRSPTARTVAGVKDALNQSFIYQGTDPSQRMGKLVLDDKAQIRDHTTAEFERQKYVDKIHSQVVSSLAQIAMGLGTADQTRRNTIIESGRKSLSDLVGEDEAISAVHNLTAWLNGLKVSDSVFNQRAWDTIERDSKLESVIRAALEKDPVVAEIRHRINRYANPGKVKSATSKVVDMTLNTSAWLAPGFAIPIAAEAALDGYMMATGGTEESKIEKELVYDKRIQSRLRVLNSEASLALDNYRFAQVTHNLPLLTFSEAVITDMANESVAKKVFQTENLAINRSPVKNVVPGIVESQDSLYAGNARNQGVVKAALKQINSL